MSIQECLPRHESPEKENGPSGNLCIVGEVSDLAPVDIERVRRLKPPVSVSSSAYNKLMAYELTEYVVDLVMPGVTQDPEIKERFEYLIIEAVKKNEELIETVQGAKEEKMRKTRPVPLEALDIVVEAYDREFSTERIDSKTRSLAVGVIYSLLMPKNQQE